MFRVCVCVCFIFIFLGSPEGEKKIRFFYSFCRDKKYETLFSLGTNRERERERENVVFEEALS